MATSIAHLLAGRLLAFWGLFWLFAALCSSTAQAQNMPPTTAKADTTKKDSVRYGPNTTAFYLEDEIFRNKEKKHYLDTAIHNMHRYNAVQANQNIFQDLGVFGSATQSVFYQMPTQIGTRLGYTAFDFYQFAPNQIKYFDTYSPQSTIDYVQGGKGRTRVRVNLARNVNPNWNIGLVFQRQESNKIFGREARRNDPMVVNQTYGAHTSYFSPRGRYKMLANFFYYEHTVAENGGYDINQVQVQDLSDLLTVDQAQLKYRLQNATNRQRKSNFHLYQQFGLFKDSTKQQKNELQLFHILDWGTQRNSYTDARLDSNLAFYPNRRVAFDPSRYVSNQQSGGPGQQTTASSPQYAQRFGLIDNRLGIKGKFSEFRYRAYARLRQYQLATDFVSSRTSRDSSATEKLAAELFIGGGMDYTFKDSALLEVEAEHLLAKDYRLRANYAGKWLNASVEQAFYAPDLVQRRVYGSFFEWDNNFKNTFVTRLQGGLNSIKVPLPYLPDSLAELRIAPYASFANIQDLVYYDTLAVARQSGEALQVLQAGLRIEARWRDLRNSTQVLFARRLGADVLRLPQWTVNSQFYIERKIFNNALYGQVGIDLWWKSGFLANDYMPATQQFFLQNRYKTNNFLVVDLFFNFKIQRALLFIKIVNLTQDLAARAYFDTPRYFAQPRSLELGIRWMFFD